MDPIPEARRRIRRAYRRETASAGGTWRALVTLVDRDGASVTAVEERADEIVAAASVNKIGIACAVLDKVDQGRLRLAQTVELTPDVVLPDDGIYQLQTVWGDRLTLANVLVAMLAVSDNTAVRLCGLVSTGTEVNEYLASRGCTRTSVQPLPTDPHRMFLGTTTARESHAILHRLVTGTMLSAGSTRFLLDILRWTGGVHDGVRHTMSSAERARTAAKHGADENWRHEAGVMFGSDGTPKIVFSFLADLPGHGDNFGATHPLVRARARIGRRMCDQAPTLTGRA